MTAAYASIKELYWQEFRDHLTDHGFDISHYDKEDVMLLMTTTASFWDRETFRPSVFEQLHQRVEL